MNKSAIKNYAVWARNELIARVSQKAYEYGVTEKETPKYDSELVNGKLLSNIEKKQLNELISQVNKHGFNHVMEEVAYTWFNRFIALRFMEVNNYLPQKINIFTDGNNNFKPQILSEAIHLEIDGVDKKKVFKFIEQNNQEELYKYLLLSVCNDMNKYLLDMFTPITDYKALLIPDHLLNEGSVLDRLIKDIPEEDWTEQVQIIGWLYQYYNSELKDIVMKKKDYAKDDIPAATQLFTPDWIVRYMVENSLGRLWIDGHPSFKYNQWKYYLEEAEQEPEVLEQLNIIKQEHAKIKPEEIKVIDPCMGSGHILVYAFDILMDIYRDNGYSDRDAARSIVEKNIYGIEIDERAYQLAYFAIMMKARSYNRRILNEHIRHNLVEITESNTINKNLLHYLGDYEETGRKLIELFRDAKEFGSLINVDIPVETLDRLDERLTEVDQMADYGSLLVQTESIELVQSFEPILKEARILAQKYDVVVTNPPYMKADNMSFSLSNYIKHYQNKAKYDIYAAFIYKANDMVHKNGYISLITMHNFMFSPSFKDMRNDIKKWQWINLVHLGSRAFSEISGEVVQTAAYVIRKNRAQSNIAILDVTKRNNPIEKEIGFFDVLHDYILFNTKSIDFIPGNAFGYLLSNKVIELYNNGDTLNKYGVTKAGVVTGSDPDFVRNWFEVDINDITFKPNSNVLYKYVLFSKGGTFNKWYGNSQNVLLLSDMWDDKKTNKSVRRGDINFYYKRGIGWSQMGGGVNKCFSEIVDSVCKTTTPMFYANESEMFNYVLGYLNSAIPPIILKALNPTLSILTTDIMNLPFIYDEKYHEEIDILVNDCIFLSKKMYEYYEEHWQFRRNCLIQEGLLEEAFIRWNEQNKIYKSRLLKNEIRINQIFSKIMCFGSKKTRFSDSPIFEKSSDNSSECIKRLIMYSVGCMFGRYSPDIDGIAYAGGEWDESKYRTFIPDQDNIVPVYEDEFYGDDDITSRFFKFVKVVFGEDNLEVNLKFIADSLGGKGTPRKVIRDYFINDFFEDHCKFYQKLPIYWQFDSGKKNGFKALIYIHRYKPDLIARMRTEYVHPQQARYRTQINMLENQIGSVSKSDEIKIKKEIQTIKEKADELAIYEEKIHHWADKMEPMDLDDGVVNNYNKFQELLVPNVVKKQK